MPCGGALLGGLAEEETELLQALGENIFAGHCVEGFEVVDGGGEYQRGKGQR